MGILDRVSTLLRANINDLIDRAEDPEKVVRQLVTDLNAQMLQVKLQVAGSLADEKQMRARYEEQHRKSDEWKRKAELAVENGQDELAREALRRSNTNHRAAEVLRQQHEDQARQVRALRDAVAALEAKVREAAAKKDLLIARSRQAKAEINIHTALSGMGRNGAFATLNRMEERVNTQEARARALADLALDSTELRFGALERESTVDQQLAELKARKALSSGPAATALESTKRRSQHGS